MNSLRFLLSKATNQSTIELNVPAARAHLESHDALVAALREIVAKVGDREGMGDLGGKPDAYLRAIRDVARAALAKAGA